MFQALRSRDYRWFWLSRLAGDTALWVQGVAIGWLVYDLTGSALYLGMVGFAQAIPRIVLSFLGGAMADRVPKRELVCVAQSVNAALVFLVAFLISTGLIEVWHVLTISFLTGAVASFDGPARQAIMAELVGREELMNAVALNAASHNGTRIIGPSISGVMIALWGNAVSLYATGFLIVLGVACLQAIRIAATPAGSRPGLVQGFGELVAYLRGSPLAVSVLALVGAASFFGMSAMYLLPVFAGEILDVGPTGLGALQGVSAAGAFVATLGVAAISAHLHKERLLFLGIALLGLCLTVFAYVTWFPAALAIMFVYGAALSGGLAVANTLMQLSVSDEMRGRAMGVYWASNNGLHPLGGIWAGSLGAAVGVSPAVAASGAVILVTAGAVLVLLTTRSSHARVADLPRP